MPAKCLYMKSYLIVFSFIFLVISCKPPENESSNFKTNDFSFSSNKIWAHRVNTFEEAEKKHSLFDGMEIDLIYSSFINNLYVAHDDSDTLRNILLEEWLKHIPNPEKNWYWLDMKNLNKKNAEAIAALLVDLLDRYGIQNKTICESKNLKALAVLKNNNIAVSYWVTYDATFRKFTGNTLWKKRIERKIARLNPNALSCFARMHPLLDASFPNKNILYWHFSNEKTTDNDEIIRKLCRSPNVKVVLIDYDEPISYE